MGTVEEENRRQTRQRASKNKQLLNQQSGSGFHPFNPDRYCLNPNQFHFIIDYIYDLFAVTNTRGLRRICVSFAVGLACFLIGLIIAAFIGFTTVYVSSPVPYLLPILTIIV